MAETAKIAIVDDDQEIREAITTLVETVGLRAEGFSSAEEFLSSPQAQDSACLILDVRMPGMSGFELQRQLVAANWRIPILLFSVRAHGGRLLSTGRRVGIVDRCVSAYRAGRVATRFIAGPVSDNCLSAGCPGTQCRSTSAPGTRGDRIRPGIALRRPASARRPHLRAVFRRPRGVRRPSTGVAAADAAGRGPGPVGPIRRCGCVVARQTRYRLLPCEAPALHDGWSWCPLHRASVLPRGLSAVGLIRPPRSTDPGAARRFTAPVPVVQATERLLLHRASPSMRCPRAG